MEHERAEGWAPPGPAETVLRSSAQVSVITAVARLVGFARWIVLGLAVGTTYLGNTYQTANWIPNIVFELVAGGVLSAVFVPALVRALEGGRRRADEVASSLANTFLLLSVPVVLAAAVAARPIMTALTVAVDDPVIRAQQIETGAWFLYVFLPQIPLYVMAMVMTGVLHAHRRFVAPAAAPLFSSLVVIATYVAFAAMGAGAELGTVTDGQRWVLAGGTTAGVLVLAASQVPSVLRTGMRWHPRLAWGDPAVRRAVQAGLWGVLFFAVTQVGLLATLVFANRVRGGVVAFRVAFAFYELPKALIGLPVAIALLPALARCFTRSDQAGFARLTSAGWRVCVFAGAPAAAGLFVLAPTLSDAILAGAPTVAAPGLVGAMTAALALGVPAFVLTEPLVRSFYARGETHLPVWFNAAGVVLTVAVMAGLTIRLRPDGMRALEVIGWSTAAGAWLGVAVGLVLLANRVPAWPVWADLRASAASLLRAGVMGTAVWATVSLTDLGPRTASVLGLAVGLLVYGTLSLRSAELKRTVEMLRGRV